MHKQYTMKEVNICVLGSGGVGKSAVVSRYVRNIFLDKYDPTIEDSYRKTVVHNNSLIELHILDTAGTEQFTVMRDMYIKKAHGILLIFSVIDKQSLLELCDIYKQIEDVKNNVVDIPIILCGNKIDLDEYRVVYKEDVYEKINKLKYDKYFDISAKDNVDEIFEALLELVVANVPDKHTSRKCRCTIV